MGKTEHLCNVKPPCIGKVNKHINNFLLHTGNPKEKKVTVHEHKIKGNQVISKLCHEKKRAQLSKDIRKIDDKKYYTST